MRPPRHDLANRAFQLLSIVEARTEHDLCMVVGPCRLQAVELLRDLLRTFAAQHLRPQFRVHALHRNVERREMVLRNTLEVGGPHIRHRDKVAIEETQAVVIVLDGQAAAHIGRNHIDETEAAMVRTVANAIEDGTLELDVEFLVHLLVEGDDLLLAIRMFHEQFNLLVGHGKAQIDDIAQVLPVDRENLIPRYEAELRAQSIRMHAQDFAGVLHIFSPLS